jgi:hypothetical protein
MQRRSTLNSVPDSLPPQLLAQRLHELVDLYLAEALEHGDLGALGPLRLLRDRVEVLAAEHVRAAHNGDGRRPWREVAEALAVTTSAVSAWARSGSATAFRGSVPRARPEEPWKALPAFVANQPASGPS